MSRKSSKRWITFLASTSVLALALAAAPVPINFDLSQPMLPGSKVALAHGGGGGDGGGGGGFNVRPTVGKIHHDEEEKSECPDDGDCPKAHKTGEEGEDDKNPKSKDTSPSSTSPKLQTE